MHRIWVGLEPRLIMSVLGSFIAGAVLVLHIWAFNQFNWPGTLKATYATAPAATR
jgi:hypothetical protein